MFRSHTQCCHFRRNTAEVTPKVIYFRYLKNPFLDKSIQKIFCLTCKKEALVIQYLSLSRCFPIMNGSELNKTDESVKSPYLTVIPSIEQYDTQHQSIQKQMYRCVLMYALINRALKAGFLIVRTLCTP